MELQWLKILEIPALMVAALCIWVLYSLLKSRDEIHARLAVEMAENSKAMARLAALLDVICTKLLGGPRQ